VSLGCRGHFGSAGQPARPVAGVAAAAAAVVPAPEGGAGRVPADGVRRGPTTQGPPHALVRLAPPRAHFLPRCRDRIGNQYGHLLSPIRTLQFHYIETCCHHL